MNRAHRTPWGRRRAALVATGAAVIAVVLVAGAGAASPTGVVQATINVGPQTPPPVYSITVSPGSTSYCTTVAPLTLPSGYCTGSDSITVTMGATAGEIDVNGADAVPADAGVHWTLCDGVSVACTGENNTVPGVDQYAEEVVNGTAFQTLLNSPTCDSTWTDCTSVASNASHVESLSLRGPVLSTDSSSTFTTSITWTAGP